MKIKPASRKGQVVVELKSKEEGLLNPLAFRLQRILVPVDFSSTSRKALQYAVPFATAFDAKVTVLHVIQPYTAAPELGYMPPELVASQRDLANSVREELGRLCQREFGTGARFQVQVCEGVPWQEITTAACESDADLIILATHGRTGLKHVLLGSVTERVVRHAPCPVLVVRARERDFIPSGARDDLAK